MLISDLTRKVIPSLTVSLATSFGILGSPALAHFPHSSNEPSGEGSVVVVPVSEQKSVWLTSDRATFAAVGDNTNGEFSLFDIYAPPQVGTLLHSHDNEDEGFFILEGNVSFQIDDQAFTATPGSFVYLPKGHPHAWRNLGDTGARVATFTTPSGLERLFEAVGLPVTDPNTPPPFNPKILAVGGTKLFGVEAPDQLLFSASSYTVNEDGTPVTPVTVFRPAKTTGEVGATVELSDGTAQYPSDYSNPHTLINFADQQQLQQVLLPLVDDLLAEGNEILEMKLNNPTGGTRPVLLYNKAFLNIIDNDQPPDSSPSEPLDIQALYDFPLVEPKANPFTFSWGNGLATEVATEEETKGQYSLLDVLLPADSDFSDLLNTSNRSQGLYVLGGDLTLEANGKVITAAPQTFIYLPKNTPYRIGNTGSTPGRLLVFDSAIIPEPNLITGILTIAALGIGIRLKHKCK